MAFTQSAGYVPLVNPLRFAGERDCTSCGLHQHRKNVVVGDGAREAGIMVIGEAPGQADDRHGRAFAGKAGRVLDKWFKIIGLDRKRDFYITTAVKCRPPANREPKPIELTACKSWLTKELRKVKPWLVIPIGKFASCLVLQNEKFSIVKGSGRVYPRVLTNLGYNTDDFVLVFPMLHPAYVLRNPSAEQQALDDVEWLKKEVLK